MKQQIPKHRIALQDIIGKTYCQANSICSSIKQDPKSTFLIRFSSIQNQQQSFDKQYPNKQYKIKQNADKENIDIGKKSNQILQRFVQKCKKTFGYKTPAFARLSLKQKNQTQQKRIGYSTKYSQSSLEKFNIVYEQFKNSSCNLKVYARFRPLLFSELDGQQQSKIQLNNNSVFINKQNFTLDHIFTSQCNQKYIYGEVAYKLIKDVMKGINATIFAYGQTGSGKTYTMYGDIYNQKTKGIIPRAIDQIFKIIQNTNQQYLLSCSMTQIYKQILYDLLDPQKPQLKIKESKQGFYVDKLSQIQVNKKQEIMALINFGHKIRKVSSTFINCYSSRSHMIFTIKIKIPKNVQTFRISKLTLVDLAGCQKIFKSGASGQTLQQAKKINLSLSILGIVINSLTSDSQHIPYRNSKLTKLLQDALGGNSKTSMIVNCSMSSFHLDQTISSLKFACRAKFIKNNLRVNQQYAEQKDLRLIVKQLQKQLRYTKEQLDYYKEMCNNLKKKNKQNEHKFKCVYLDLNQ